QTLKSEWDGLKAKTLTQPVDESAAAHAALAGHAAQMTALLLANSKMTSDSDTASRTLIHMAGEDAPSALTAMAELRQHAIRAAIKGYLGGDDRTGITIFRDRMMAQFATITASLDLLDPTARTRMQPAVNEANAAIAQFNEVVKTKITGASEMKSTGIEM